MWEIENNFSVKIGSNYYINTPVIVAFRNTPIFTVKRHDETGYLGIYFEIYNSKGERIASVKRNEIYYGNKEDFEISGSHNQITFTEKSTGTIICDIKKREEAHPTELDISVKLYLPDGRLFDATPERTNIGNNMLRGCVMQDCGVGINIG